MSDIVAEEFRGGASMDVLTEKYGRYGYNSRAIEALIYLGSTPEERAA